MSLKESRLAQFFYKFPGVSPAYHFLWAWIAARRHGNPSKRLFVIGITGTKGKTTTLELLNAILENAGRRTALLSSLRVKIGSETMKNPMGNSMPGRGYIQRFLARALKAGCNYALVEVTSQGVAQSRHRFIRWNIGALTNLSPEHIEAHGSFENYRKAKLDFLKYVLAGGGKVFLNRDDKHFPFFEGSLASARTLAYTKEDGAFADRLARLKRAQAVRGEVTPKFLLSEFNAENIAAAVAIAKELGIADRTIDDALAAFSGVPGRMQFVTAGSYTAIVDYAHTPDSLEAAYKAARPKPDARHPHPRLICVLGAAGGGRDRWKRPEMGAIAAKYCDELILTNEDPYDEDPSAIMEEIESGVREAAPEREFYKILDRREAIYKAVEIMEEGDVVIGTGKGSEDWIHGAKGAKEPWSERKVFEESLAQKRTSG